MRDDPWQVSERRGYGWNRSGSVYGIRGIVFDSSVFVWYWNLPFDTIYKKEKEKVIT